MPGATSVASRPPLPRIAFVEQSPTAAADAASKSPPSASAEPEASLRVITALPQTSKGLEALTFPHVSRHGSGLKNRGTTCFMNSTIQALIAVPAIAHVIEAHVTSRVCRGRSSFCPLCALGALARALGRGAGPVMPSAFTGRRNMNAISSSLRVDRQEDAHEFLKELLDASMRADALGCGAWASSKRGGLPLNRKLEMSGAVHAACGGVLQSGVECGSCGHESLTMEPFYDISVGCENTVEKALGKYTAPERMAGTNAYRCEGCKKKVVASKRYQVRTASNSLMVHCNRFIGTRKDRRKMQYGPNLDLAPFMAEKPAGGKMLYDLVGVVVHQGNTTLSGHYFSYVKGSNGTWALKNDTMSRVVSASEVLNQQAYILLYARDAAAAAAAAPASKTSAFDVVKKVLPQAVSRILSLPPERTADQSSPVPTKAKVSPKVSPKSSPKKRERVSPYSGARRAQSSDGSVGRKDRELPANVPAPSQPVKGRSQDIFLHSVPEPEDGVIRTFISGGSNAVRLLARKVLNYRAGSPSGSSSGGAKEGKAMSDGCGCGSGTDQGSFDCAPIEQPKSRGWLSPRLSPRSKSPPQPSDPDSERKFAIAAETLEVQKVPEKMNPWKVSGESKEAVTQKVGLWCEDDSMQGQFGSARLSSKSLQKRSRAQDGGDADYDRGKEKKVRRKDARSNSELHSGESWVYVNPFAADRAPIG